jgi:hypothetical protein
MMADLNISGEFFTFALGVASGMIALYAKTRREAHAEYDRDIRTKRFEAYKELWKLTQPLAKYSPPGPVTEDVLRGMSSLMRVWYFETGGIIMTSRSRDAYFALQDSITIHLGDRAPKKGDKVSDIETISKRASTLRTAMTADVGTRLISSFIQREA